MSFRFLLSLLVLVTVRVQAQVLPTDSLSEYELGAVTVTSGKAESESGVHRISMAAIRETSAPTVAGAMTLVPAAHAVANSRGETVLSLRGAPDRQTSVFFDGARITLPWDQRLDLGLVPAAAVGGLTAVPGTGALAYGPNTLGGAIAITSLDRHSEGRTVEGGGEIGAGEFRRGTVTWAERSGRWSTALAADAYERGGEQLATDLPYSQDASALRTNTDVQQASLFSRVAFQPSEEARVGLALFGTHAEKGVAPEGHLDPEAESVRYWRYPHWRYGLAILSGEQNSKRVTTRGAVWVGRASQTIARYAEGDYASVEQEERRDDTLWGARALITHQDEWGTLQVAGSATYAAHDEREEPSAPRRYRQTLGSASLEGERVVPGGAAIQAGVGVDVLATHEAGGFETEAWTAAPALRLGMTFGRPERTSAHITIARRTRFPSMRERYDDALGRFVPNPALRPEAAWLLDVGLRGRPLGQQAGAVLFARRTTGTVEVVRTVEGFRERVNLGGSTALGAEATVSVQMLRHVRIDAHGTALYTRAFTDEEDGLRLRETPALLARLAVARRPPLGIVGGVEGVYRGAAYSDGPDGLARLNGALLIHGHGGYRYAVGGKGVVLETFVRIENVVDTAYFPQAGLPVPGRYVKVGFRGVLG